MFMIFLRKPAAAACLKILFTASLAAWSLLLCCGPRAEALSPEGMNAWFCGGSSLQVSSAAAAAPVSGAAQKDGGEDSFSALKPEGARRVFVIGESAAGLLGPGENTALSAALGNVFPGGPVELINCSPWTYGERSTPEVFEKVLAYEPDMLVVLSGGISPGTGAGSAPVRRTGPDAELRAMARLARAKGVPVVFGTLPANMRDYAPAGELPFEQVWLLKGLALLEKKDHAGALKFFELNLKSHPREPFSLFYAGRALDGLGRAKDAAAYYADAIKHDPARDRCPAERNEMIRRAASDEGVCLADLERAFSGIAADGITGGSVFADGSRWFREYGVFVSSVIARAARACAPAAGSAAGVIPVPGAPPGRAEYADEHFRAVFSYAGSELSTGTFSDAPASERAVVMLERLYSMDRARLEKLLFSPAEPEKDPKNGFPGNALNKDPRAWRPELLYSAAEMFRRSGNGALALRSIDAALRLKADYPAFNLARWRIRRAAGETEAGKDLAKAAAGPRTRSFLAYLDAALDLAPGPLPALASPGTPPEKNAVRDGGVSKKISDEAVELMTKGDAAGARAMLTEAVARDRDNFEARMNLCSLAMKTGDVPLGEEHCNEAVFLAVAPPKHAVPSKDRPSSAFYSRGLFYLAAGNKAEACRDLRRASAEAPSEWLPAADALEQAKKACGK